MTPPLCPSCSSPLPLAHPKSVITCPGCGKKIDGATVFTATIGAETPDLLRVIDGLPLDQACAALVQENANLRAAVEAWQDVAVGELAWRDRLPEAQRPPVDPDLDALWGAAEARAPLNKTPPSPPKSQG